MSTHQAMLCGGKYRVESELFVTVYNSHLVLELLTQTKSRAQLLTLGRRLAGLEQLVKMFLDIRLDRYASLVV
jgi:hypothetical protein